MLKKSLIIIQTLIVVCVASLASPSWSGVLNFKNWQVDEYEKGGTAYASNSAGLPYLAISCFDAIRNVITINPDLQKYVGQREALVKVKEAAKFPVLVFDDDFNKPFKLKLGADPSGASVMVLGSSITLPNGKVLRI